jgi:hypothetical protein
MIEASRTRHLPLKISRTAYILRDRRAQRTTPKTEVRVSSCVVNNEEGTTHYTRSVAVFGFIALISDANLRTLRRGMIEALRNCHLPLSEVPWTTGRSRSWKEKELKDLSESISSHPVQSSPTTDSSSITACCYSTHNTNHRERGTATY